MGFSFDHTPPVIKLRHYTHSPYSDAIAAARTCYSQNVIEAKEVTEKQKGYIGPLTFNAGHHTVYQHATFEFSMENVSRHFIWSVLHSFPFYNSDQQSQRYVRLDKVRAALPPFINPASSELYKKTILDCFQTYQQLSEILKTDTLELVGKIRHADKHPHPRLLKYVEREADKKAIEIGRYVLPIATGAALVYTCSGLVLHRLWRLMNTGDVSFEAKTVIGEMVRLVREVDSDFFTKVGDEPMREDQITESAFLTDESPAYDPKLWDQDFGTYKMSKLLDHTQNAKTILATSVRFALGSQSKNLTDEALIALALDPKQNKYRIEKTNLSSHSPIMRSLNHVYYTFLKKLSHSADSQNQRHRMVPGSRPFFSLVDSDTPDYFTPMLIERNQKAKALYDTFMEKIWDTKNTLIKKGEPKKYALYVLPNAVNVRFMESGSLLNLIHKWTLRTCLNAQEEIFDASMEEVKQVAQVHPFLAPFIGPPCVIRNGVVTPKCTEGDKFCGVTVWKQFPNIQRLL